MGNFTGFEHAAKDVDDIRIELGAGAAVHNTENLGLFHALTIGPVRGDGIIHISDAEDPGQEGNIFPFQFVGVAGTVKAFTLQSEGL